MWFIIWLKSLPGKITVLVGIPLIGIALTFLWFQGTGQYHSQAQISLGEILPDSLPTGFHQELPTDRQIDALIQVTYSTEILDLLACRLLLHDLEAPRPFRDTRNLRSKYSSSMLSRVSKRLETKWENLEKLSPQESADRQVISLLKSLDYHPAALRKHLEIEAIEGTDRLNISFSSENPNLSAFVVNMLSDLLIRYLIKEADAKQKDEFFTMEEK